MTAVGLAKRDQIVKARQSRNGSLKKIATDEKGLAGLATAWAMERGRPEEYRRKVDAATRCSGVCPHT